MRLVRVRALAMVVHGNEQIEGKVHVFEEVQCLLQLPVIPLAALHWGTSLLNISVERHW